MTKPILFLILGLLSLPSLAIKPFQSFIIPTQCDPSPIGVILEAHYTGHPYRDINLKRSPSDQSPLDQEELLGNQTNYQIGDQIGKGGYSFVYKGTHTPSSDKVALKVSIANKKKQLTQEINILQELKNAPNVLPLRDIIVEKNNSQVNTTLVFDYFSFNKYQDMVDRMTPYMAQYLTYQTLLTLEYAHSRGIVHRDIKLVNTLVNASTQEVRIIDWGISDYYYPNKDYGLWVTTLNYKGPELLLKYQKHDYTLDIWSAGCNLAEMTFKKYHFFQAKEKPDPSLPKAEVDRLHLTNHLDAIARVLGTGGLKRYADKFKKSMDPSIIKNIGNYKKVPLTRLVNDSNRHLIEPNLIDLLEKMFTYDHTKRITAKQALLHPYFAEVRKNIKAGKHPHRPSL